MIEIIKEAGDILKDLPDLAIYILVGILFYKTFIIGSIFAVVRLAINRTHSILTKPKKEVFEHKIDNHFIRTDGTYDLFMSLISDVESHFHGDSYVGSKYICKSHVLYLKQAFKEKIERDKNES